MPLPESLQGDSNQWAGSKCSAIDNMGTRSRHTRHTGKGGMPGTDSKAYLKADPENTLQK